LISRRNFVILRGDFEHLSIILWPREQMMHSYDPERNF
jgi:hypothetical protein